MLFKLRTAGEADLPFIFDSWLKSWRTSKYAGVIRNDQYFSVMRETIESLIGRGAELIVATAENNDTHLLGWICHEVTGDGHAVVHYLYVKDPYHRYKIDASLLDCVQGTKPGFYTFNYTQVKNALESKWLDKWSWVPEIARRK